MMSKVQIVLLLFIAGWLAAGVYIVGIELIFMNKKLEEILREVKRFDHDES